MAVWRRKSKPTAMIHSGEGSHFKKLNWKNFIKTNNLIISISGRSNHLKSAAAESFQSLKIMHMRSNPLQLQLHSSTQQCCSKFIN